MLGFVGKINVNVIDKFKYLWMKAIFIMPPNFFAIFSNREKIRRFSFSQPTWQERFSTVLQPPTASLIHQIRILFSF